jgi:hypothetical protein
MEIFENVHLGPTVDLDDLVAKQLENGLLRGRQDGRPADWLVRAWFEPKLSPALRQRLAASIHRGLSHPNLNVVAEAVAALDGCPQMQDSAALNSFAAVDSEDAQDRLTTLFRQLRAQDSRDRGADLLRIILQHATLPSAIRLSRSLALSKEFGRVTLAYLCQDRALLAMSLAWHDGCHDSSDAIQFDKTLNLVSAHRI